MRIEQTQSRSRQTNDNALAESKNASTVRKYLGYSHLCPVGTFLNTLPAKSIRLPSSCYVWPYLNYHRPCHFPTEYMDQKGKICKRYPYQDMMTPYEKFRSLPEAAGYLKPGNTLEKLDTFAAQCSDNDAAQHLNENEARATLFQLINKSQQSAA